MKYPCSKSVQSLIELPPNSVALPHQSPSISYHIPSSYTTYIQLSRTFSIASSNIPRAIPVRSSCQMLKKPIITPASTPPTSPSPFNTQDQKANLHPPNKPPIQTTPLNAFIPAKPAHQMPNKPPAPTPSTPRNPEFTQNQTRPRPANTFPPDISPPSHRRTGHNTPVIPKSLAVICTQHRVHRPYRQTSSRILTFYRSYPFKTHPPVHPPPQYHPTYPPTNTRMTTRQTLHTTSSPPERPRPA